VRKTRSSGDRKLEAALADLAAALNATAVPWMVIGGIAVIARGVRRMTTDIDATVRGDQLDVASLLKALAKKRIVPRIRDAERFASESLVLLLKHQPTGVEIDVSMAWTDFEHEALAAGSVTKFGTANVPMAQAEDLIVFKAIAGRPKDVQDATTLLVLYSAIDRSRVRRRVSQLAALADDLAPVNVLEAVIAAAGTTMPQLRTAKLPPRRRALRKGGIKQTKPGKRG
jgi:hypothetical protein